MSEAFEQLTSIDYLSIFSSLIIFIAATTTLKVGIDKFFETFEIIPP